MADLFQRSGLEQDTGRISPRWGQDGSTIKNFSGNTITATTNFYSVPSGKVVYVTDIIVQSVIVGAIGDYGYFNDALVSNKIYVDLANAVAGEHIYLHFDTPLVFTDAIFWTEGGGAATNINVAITGWEEGA